MQKYLRVWTTYDNGPLGAAVRSILEDEFKHEDAVVMGEAERRLDLVGECDTQIVSIVDDDESLRRSLRNLLGSVGFRLETFASAEAFLQSIHPLGHGFQNSSLF